MTEKDKRLADSIAKILCALPSGKKEYLAGVADGMFAMTATEPPRPAEQREGA